MTRTICNQFVSTQSKPSDKKVDGFDSRPMAVGLTTSIKLSSGISIPTELVLNCAVGLHGVPLK